jgi:hypothetical protein
MQRPTKITFGEMREYGIRGVLIYCTDYKCSHSVAVMADQWADDVILGCRILRTVSPALPAASAAPTCGRIWAFMSA